MAVNLVQVDQFINSTRDSGYRSLSHALAELIDNSIEAGATKVDISIAKGTGSLNEQIEIQVADNGTGMSKEEICVALQFGGSTRFNCRSKFGRFGMGLPNSTLSQCRRVEVVSWRDKRRILFSYLDVDEIIERKLARLPPPVLLKAAQLQVDFKSGTVVTLKKCDRIEFRYIGSVFKQLHSELGRIYRNAIWSGVDITVGQNKVIPYDPLFIRKGANISGANLFGKGISYSVKIPGRGNRLSLINVRFSELPVHQWASLSNDEKRRAGIVKKAGVSILRSGREIDYGWFFMGDKRKENYDDWWRCEISFTPELDELFGVTHTKQSISETDEIKNILVSDLQNTAKILNNRVRRKFMELKMVNPVVYSKFQLERTDVYLPPLKLRKSTNAVSSNVTGMQYKIIICELKENMFYDVVAKQNIVILRINSSHMFCDKIFRALHERKINSSTELLKVVEILIFAAARAELSYKGEANAKIITEFKNRWSKNLKTLIS